MHSAKGKAFNIPHKDNLLGSRVIEGYARIVIELKRDLDNSRKIHSCAVKGNHIKDPEIKRNSFVLQMDEHRLFQDTGERVLFEDTVKKKRGVVVDTGEPRKAIKSKRSKLTHEEKKEIIERLKKGERQTVLAKEYGVTQGAISQLWRKYNRDEIILD